MKRKKYIIEEPKLEDLNLEEPQYNIFYEVENWIDKKFSNPNATIRLATMFSGIGSIEHALKRSYLHAITISTLNKVILLIMKFLKVHGMMMSKKLMGQNMRVK